MQRPPATRGLHHVALHAVDFNACRRFYVDLLGMRVEWQPDPDNLYLTSGSDNLALHRASGAIEGPQHLDHIGFILARPADVDAWFEYLRLHDVSMRSEPRTHRDGARSFYCQDPDGNTVQMIYHPPLSNGGEPGEGGNK
ncbi:MAG: VOC family protein [Pseudomonadota bacterium]|nr:MAG: VOC family protein [Pseudomonadota bacterium]